ncbi:MAG: hypothetical protein R3265_17065, partial [Hyphomonas sp.]|nr:hypothetical protein [Hyphomonas sp.]
TGRKGNQGKRKQRIGKAFHVISSFDKGQPGIGHANQCMKHPFSSFDGKTVARALTPRNIPPAASNSFKRFSML